MKRTLTEQEERVLGERLVEIFNLPRDRTCKATGHDARYQCVGGNKTTLGLARVFIRLCDELEEGRPPHQLFT